MPNNAAALWSAVAASFAALSSFLIMMIQRRNLLESVRPELVLTGWGRLQEGQGDAAHEVIVFESVRNVGRGAALRVILNGSMANQPVTTMAPGYIPLLAANEASDVNGSIHLWWKNAEAQGNKGFKYFPVMITIFCWDSRGMRHETRYSLMALELSGNVGGTNEVAPGVILAGRTTTTRPVWLLKLFRELGRVPLLGRLFRQAR
ncbi:MAG: hypothetical protein IMZ65_01485 [Planctomycetes bacterium]|nr:hypothetical protein [Planctomycetota bacterium]